VRILQSDSLTGKELLTLLKHSLPKLLNDIEKNKKTLPAHNATLSLIIHLIVCKLEHFSTTLPPTERRLPVFSTCISLRGLINKLRISDSWAIHSNVIIWCEDRSYIRLFPTAFTFHCTCRGGDESAPAQLPLNYEDFTQLRYGTSASSLLNILALHNFNNENPTHHIFYIKTNRGREQSSSDTSSNGLLYCGIHVPEDALYSFTQNSHCIQNRYGTCLLNFNVYRIFSNSTSEAITPETNLRNLNAQTRFYCLGKNNTSKKTVK
jgi:hypothetical protein